MTARDLRRKYLEFFESKGHHVYPSGSLVPYDVTGKLDESLLFNGAGMVQFKPFFRGVATPPNPRLTTAQKCVRTGDIDEVGNLSHLTFFEMLGNFSFGDYFKREAIALSWEFLTDARWLGLDPKRLAFTVFEEDDEAYGYWSAHLESVGIDPATRIFRLGEEKNYWPASAFTNGPPGPCGPNSEMFFWTLASGDPPSGPYTVEDYKRDDAAGRWLEIWNDVFIQYEWQGRLKDPARPASGYVKEGMPNLPFLSVDTGMGLERTAAVLNGFSSVYDTDLFVPIVSRIVGLMNEAGHAHAYGDEPTRDRAIRIVADHIRTASFCIADGVLPSNTGRGYVLRRVIRRAVLKGQRVLGFESPFFHLAFDGVLEAMADHYSELRDREAMIRETLLNEETQFRRTLHAGSQVLQDELEAMRAAGERRCSGEKAFRLYDTFGFPLEVTRELAEEAGFELDEEGFEAALREAQERSRAGSDMDTVYAAQSEDAETIAVPDAGPTEFTGYLSLAHEARVTRFRPVVEEGKLTDRALVTLDRSPFYAASGGQESDHGRVRLPDLELKIEEGKKEGDLIWYSARLGGAAAPRLIGKQVGDLRDWAAAARVFEAGVAEVDPVRRQRILPHHTATHLLHAALRRTLGVHVTQAGSLVAEDQLRFDFTHGKAMSPEEVAQVEQWVNEQVWKAIEVRTLTDVPIAEAKAMGAMALFGEKYGDRVRVVQIGEVSTELCGGTHVRNTAEIGLFRILHESSAASGVRRIVAVTGERAYRWAVEQADTVRQAAALLKANPADLVSAVQRQLDQARELGKRLERMRAQAAQAGSVETLIFGSVELALETLEEGDPKEAALVADRLADAAPNRIALVALKLEGKVLFTCKAGTAATAAGAHAGNIVREVAKIAGGGGGGRPDFATAGGKDPSRIPAAFEAAKATLAAQVGA